LHVNLTLNAVWFQPSECLRHSGGSQPRMCVKAQNFEIVVPTKIVENILFNAPFTNWKINVQYTMWEENYWMKKHQRDNFANNINQHLGWLQWTWSCRTLYRQSCLTNFRSHCFAVAISCHTFFSSERHLLLYICIRNAEPRDLPLAEIH
jgi:hypothetical protein